MSTKKGAAKKKNVEESTTDEIDFANISPEELIEKVKDNAEEQEKSFSKLQEEFVTITTAKNKLQGELTKMRKQLEHNVSLMRAWHNAFKNNEDGEDNINQPDDANATDDVIEETKPAKKPVKKVEKAEIVEEVEEKKPAKKPVKKIVQEEPAEEVEAVEEVEEKKPAKKPVKKTAEPVTEEPEEKKPAKKAVVKKTQPEPVVETKPAAKKGAANKTQVVEPVEEAPEEAKPAKKAPPKKGTATKK